MMPATTKALSAITDEGLFERLATAVLREADPLCAAVCHVGITIEGKTKKSPLDGIVVVNEGETQRLVAVQHTTTAVKSLERKWLYDPEAVKPAKSGSRSRSKAQTMRSAAVPLGDVIKVAAIVAEERKRRPNLKATVVLTTNEEPDEKLHRDVKAAGAQRQIDVEVWSQSRIAGFLDTNPTGHFIRRRLLGIEAELLSRDLLRDLSLESLRLFAPPDDPNAWVDRELDRTVAALKGPLTFLAAESGLGKTVACYRALDSHVSRGGYGLILQHELLANSTTLEFAITAAIGQLGTELVSGQNPLGFCSSERPLLVVVEDVCRSPQPQRLIEKLASWAAPKTGTTTGESSSGSLRILCPVWPPQIEVLAEQVRKRVESLTVYSTTMSADEARAAVIRRTRSVGHEISDVDASQVATALGHDPLLIALHDYSKPPQPHRVIGSFIEHALQRAQAKASVLGPDMHAALMTLAGSMLERRRLEPTWKELDRWKLEPDCKEGLRAVAISAEVLRLGGSTGDKRLLFRHDRIRDWLLVEGAVQLDESGELSDGIVAEPFYAETLGAVVVRRECQGSLLERLKTHNPLALFHALRIVGADRKAVRTQLTDAIVAWFKDPRTRSPAHSHLRWEAIIALESTAGTDVPELVEHCPDESAYRFLAALHNGNVQAGIRACARYEFGTWYPGLDRQIAHVKLHFATPFLSEVAHRLLRCRENGRNRRGLIELSGHLADAGLVAGLESLWSADADRGNYLQSYLWAFARCCDDPAAAKRTLGPICDAWADLPDRSEGDSRPSPRDDFAAHGVNWAFKRHLPTRASLNYLVSRAADPALSWPITYMLNGIDDPVPVTWVVTYVAERVRASSGKSGFLASGLIDTWARRLGGVSMSKRCREILQQFWSNREADVSLRQSAFAFWTTSIDPADVHVLRAFRGDAAIGNAVLAQQLALGDVGAVPDLVPRLRDPNQQYWWSYVHYVLTPPLVDELERMLAERRTRSQRTWLEWFDEDHYISDLLVRMNASAAEQLLLSHWDHLRFAHRFVQVALFLGSAKLAKLAHEAVFEAPEPAGMLRHTSHVFGVHWEGHPGVTREQQILALEPFLDLLDEQELSTFAQVCNENHWFETRRRLFDKRVSRQWITWNAESAASQFDDMVLRGVQWIDLDIERALKAGANWSEFLSALSDWFVSRRSLAALQMLALALVSHGVRADLEILQIFDGMPREAAAALVADTTFAVKRRTLL